MLRNSSCCHLCVGKCVAKCMDSLCSCQQSHVLASCQQSSQALAMPLVQTSAFPRERLKVWDRPDSPNVPPNQMATQGHPSHLGFLHCHCRLVGHDSWCHPAFQPFSLMADVAVAGYSWFTMVPGQFDITDGDQDQQLLGPRRGCGRPSACNLLLLCSI